ncbi:MAG: hypothetical protein ACTSQ8_06900 [Candidatus Helarchaeota archaeon]
MSISDKYVRADYTNLAEFSISGTIKTGVSNTYLIERSNSDIFSGGNYSKTWFRNATEGQLNMTLASITISVTDIRDPSYTVIVTNNDTNPDFAVPESVFDTTYAKMAQYFEIDNFSLVSKVWLFLNYTIQIPLTWGYFQVDFYNASDFTAGPVNLGNHVIFDGTGSFTGWKSITINEYLEPGAYYAVFSSWVFGFGTMNNNSWCISKDPNLIDRGPSIFRNSTGWFSIPEESHADFLLMINTTPYLSPYEVNLSAYVNDQPIQLIHVRDPKVKTPGFGRPVWKSETQYFLDAPPDIDYNVSVRLNRSVRFRSITTKARYVYMEPASGIYTINTTHMKWEVNYRKVNSSASLVVFFEFPLDWIVSDFTDSFGIEIIEYAILFSYIYGENRNGLWIDEGGDGTQIFDYSATFTSPNYLSKAQLYKKPLLSSKFSSAAEIYKGEPFKLEATIKNTEGALITTGNCTFFLYNPAGTLLYSENVTNMNGYISSAEIATQGWSSGTYTMIAFWTDGEEYGLDVYSIPVSLSPLFFMIILAVAVAASTIVALTYGRRKLAERNWIKSLHHLLVLFKKDGRPMYSYSFGSAIQDTALISGMISAMSNFVKETTGSKKQLRVIDQEDKKIILSHGQIASVAIMSNKDLPIIHKRAQSFLNGFEDQYHAKIQHWTGNTDMFKGAGKIVEDHFPITMEQKLTNKCGLELQELKLRVETATSDSDLAHILSSTTNLTEKYQDIVLRHYSNLVNQIIKLANEKLRG